MALTETGEGAALQWLTGVTPAYTPTLPLLVALTTDGGTDSAGGVEVVGGAYTRQPVTFSAVSGGACSSTGDLVWEGMPPCVVTGVEVFDSDGVRWWYGALSDARAVASGGTFEVTAGDLVLTMD